MFTRLLAIIVVCFMVIAMSPFYIIWELINLIAKIKKIL